VRDAFEDTSLPEEQLSASACMGSVERRRLGEQRWRPVWSLVDGEVHQTKGRRRNPSPPAASSPQSEQLLARLPEDGSRGAAVAGAPVDERGVEADAPDVRSIDGRAHDGGLLRGRVVAGHGRHAAPARTVVVSDETGEYRAALRSHLLGVGVTGLERPQTLGIEPVDASGRGHCEPDGGAWPTPRGKRTLARRRPAH
jgi:hypothetical protein